jgi:hypothetical protein
MKPDHILYLESETPDGLPEVVPVRVFPDGRVEEFNGSPEWGGTNEWVPFDERRRPELERVLGPAGGRDA